MTVLEEIAPTAARPSPTRTSSESAGARIDDAGRGGDHEPASVRQARAHWVHRVHAVLVIGQTQGRAIGWITTRGLLD